MKDKEKTRAVVLAYPGLLHIDEQGKVEYIANFVTLTKEEREEGEVTKEERRVRRVKRG